MGPNFASILRGTGTQQQDIYDLQNQEDPNMFGQQPMQNGFLAALLGQQPQAQAQGQVRYDMFGQSNTPAMMRRYF
jgi:hypothetical protein